MFFSDLQYTDYLGIAVKAPEFLTANSYFTCRWRQGWVSSGKKPISSRQVQAFKACGFVYNRCAQLPRLKGPSTQASVISD